MACRSVYRESLQFDQCFRPLFSHFVTMKCYKVEFAYTSSADKIGKNHIYRVSQKNCSMFD